MNLVKTQIPLDRNKGFLVDIKFCLATIGVCVFRAPASVGALFIFLEEDMKNVISVFIVLCILCTLIACSTPSADVETQAHHIHSFGEWTITKNATCTEPGEQERLCSCGEKQTQTISSTGHSFGDWTVVKDASCVESGVEECICSNCGEKKTQPIAISGHSYGDWIVTKAVTCTEDGEQEKTCSACGDKITEIISATGHSFSGQLETVKIATCTEDGISKRTCTTCGMTEEIKVAATGHKWKKATCTEPQMCSKCGATTSAGALGHNYENGKCTRCGNVSFRTITCEGVNFRIADGVFELDDAWGKEDGKYRISNVNISFERTYDSYSRFYVTYDLEKLSGTNKRVCVIHYTLKDEDGYVMSSDDVISNADMNPGDKSRDEHFSFSLQHVSGDLKKGATYTITFD